MEQRSAADAGGRSASAAQPSGTRSLLRYALVFVLLVAVVADSIQQADPDLWVHVRFGQIVLHTGHLLRRDIFSYSAPGAPWFNHEWLADVVMALFYEAGGVVGLKLMKFLCAAAIMGLLAMGTAETGADYPAQFAALLLAALGLRLQIQFRPQLFDYIFLSALLAMLARESRGRRARLWLAVPIMALWANLHGGFFIGPVVLGLYAVVAGVQDRLAGRGWRRAIKLAAITLAAAVATLVNPFGIGEWKVVAGWFSVPVVGLNRVVEFHSFFHQLATGDSWLGTFYICGFPLLITAAAVVSFALAPRRDDFALMAVGALMICAWLYAMRNMAFAVIACTAPLARYPALVIASARGAAERPPRDAAARAPVGVQLFALAAVAFLAVSGKIFSPTLPVYMDYPVGAVAFMQRNRLSGNILSTYEWGGYIVWHQVPPSKVFFDSFAERYPPSVQYDYLRFASGGSAAAQVLERYPHDYVLVPASSAMYLLMAKRNDWAPIYRDSVCVLFARAGSAPARTPVTAPAPPSDFP
jgi:hypothetical protein